MRDVLAQSLHEPVVRVVAVLPSLGGLEARVVLRDRGLPQHVVLVGEVHAFDRVGRYRRDEDVLLRRVLEELGAELRPAIVLAVVVEDDIPGPPLQCAQVAVAVPDEALDIGEVRVGPAAREDRDLVAALHGVPDRMRPDEPGPAKDEEALRRLGAVGRCRAGTVQGRSSSGSRADTHGEPGARGSGGQDKVAPAGGWSCRVSRLHLRSPSSLTRNCSSVSALSRAV